MEAPPPPSLCKCSCDFSVRTRVSTATVVCNVNEPGHSRFAVAKRHLDFYERTEGNYVDSNETRFLVNVYRL